MSRFLTIFTLVIAFLNPIPANAAQGEWATSDQARARIIAAVETVGVDEKFDAAIEFELSDEWHSYWKHAGDTGLPPRFDWSESQNVKDVEIFWPVPKRKTEQGLFTVFSYAGKQTFPLIVTPENTDEEVALNIKMDFMVCKDICIPDQMKLSLSLSKGNGETGKDAQIIDFAKHKIPQTEDIKNLKIETTVAAKDALSLVVYSKSGFENFDVFAHADELAFTSAPKIMIDENDETRAMISLTPPQDIENLKEFLSGKNLEIVLTNGRDHIQKDMMF